MFKLKINYSSILFLQNNFQCFMPLTISTFVYPPTVKSLNFKTLTEYKNITSIKMDDKYVENYFIRNIHGKVFLNNLKNSIKLEFYLRILTLRHSSIQTV